MLIKNKNFEIGKKTYIIGILNVTPDSFSDGGKFNDVERALEHAKKMIEQGADIIDIGGESTRKDFAEISEEEELSRIIPIIQKIIKETDILISVDTRKPRVAEAVLKLGASIINDFSGQIDDKMAKVCAKYGAVYIITRSYRNYSSENFIENCIKTLKNDIEIALKNGIDRKNIIIDPGLGFFNGYEENFEVINNLEKFCQLGFPVLIGASRKSFLGKLLGDASPLERESANLAITTISALKGCSFVRVHDVKKNKDALRAVEAVLKQRNLDLSASQYSS